MWVFSKVFCQRFSELSFLTRLEELPVKILISTVLPLPSLLEGLICLAAGNILAFGTWSLYLNLSFPFCCSK